MLTDPFGTNQITHAIVGCAIRVHDVVGPGVFENIYSECMQHELKDVVEKLVPVELQSIEMLLAIHKKQLLSQLRLLNLPVGLLINFNVEHFVDGVKRIINAKYKPEAVQTVPSTGRDDPTEDQQT
jgi:hypothetical protein